MAVVDVSRARGMGREFLKFWLGQSVSLVGNQFTQLALPIAAAVTLHATALEMGLLGVMRFAPGLLVGLPAGVWLDRTRRKPVLVAAQALSAATLATIPAAAVLQVLSLAQLYVVAFITGASAAVHVIALTSLLPAIAGRDRLVEANTRMQSSLTVANLVGPGVAGAAVQALTAPVAIVFDAISIGIGSLTTAWARVHEVLPAPSERHPVADAIEGQRWLWRQPLVRAIALTIVINNCGQGVILAVFVLYFVAQVGIKPAQLGLIFAAAGLSSLVGAQFSRPLVARGWLGPVMAVGAVMVVVGQAGAVVAAVAPHRSAFPILIGFNLILGFWLMVYNVNQQSIRQAVTPDRLLSRVQSGIFVLVSAAGIVGSLAGGAIGQVAGLRAAIIVGGVIALTSALATLLSPLRSLRGVPSADTGL